MLKNGSILSVGLSPLRRSPWLSLLKLQLKYCRAPFSKYFRRPGGLL